MCQCCAIGPFGASWLAICSEATKWNNRLLFSVCQSFFFFSQSHQNRKCHGLPLLPAVLAESLRITWYTWYTDIPGLTDDQGVWQRPCLGISNVKFNYQQDFPFCSLVYRASENQKKDTRVQLGNSIRHQQTTITKGYIFVPTISTNVEGGDFPLSPQFWRREAQAKPGQKRNQSGAGS